jgi:hypothetical protein
MSIERIVELWCEHVPPGPLPGKPLPKQFVAFAIAIIAEEREACAKVADSMDAHYDGITGHLYKGDVGVAIREQPLPAVP